MATSLVDDFMIANLESQLVIEKVRIDTLSKHGGTVTAISVSSDVIKEIKRQLEPLLSKRDDV